MTLAHKKFGRPRFVALVGCRRRISAARATFATGSAALAIALLSACTRRPEGPQPAAAAADSATGSVDEIGAADPAPRAPGGALNGDAAPGAVPGIGWEGLGTPGSTAVPNVILSPPTSPRAEATSGSVAPAPGAPGASGAPAKAPRPTS
jgi:hypothetical protein